MLNAHRSCEVVLRWRAGWRNSPPPYVTNWKTLETGFERAIISRQYDCRDKIGAISPIFSILERLVPKYYCVESEKVRSPQLFI